MHLIEKLSKQTKLIVACVAVFIALLIATGILPVVEDTATGTVVGLFVFAIVLSGFDYMDNKEAVKALISYVQAIQFSPEVTKYAHATEVLVREVDKAIEESGSVTPPTSAG